MMFFLINNRNHSCGRGPGRTTLRPLCLGLPYFLIITIFIIVITRLGDPAPSPLTTTPCLPSSRLALFGPFLSPEVAVVFLVHSLSPDLKFDASVLLHFKLLCLLVNSASFSGYLADFSAVS